MTFLIYMLLYPDRKSCFVNTLAFPILSIISEIKGKQIGILIVQSF